MKRHLLRHLTYANVMASIAIFLALGGTAFAALVVTGRNIKDGTLAGTDVRNGTLSAVDLSAAARASFKGAQGATGPVGAKGLTGETGPKGDKGDSGAPAEVVTSYASRDTGFVVRNNLAPPNANNADWFDYNCNGVNNDVAPCASGNGNQTNAGVGQIELNPNGIAVLALSGVNINADETLHTYSTTNNISVPWSSNLTGMVSLSMLHRGAIHERFMCELQYANVLSPSSFSSLGTPQMVSAFADLEIVSMSLVGSKNVPAGTYNVRVVCFDLDDHTLSYVSWRFVRGNLTAMAARNA